jgi:hypothetical protein
MKKLIYLSLLTSLFLFCTPLKPAINDGKTVMNEELIVNGRHGLLINQKIKFGDIETVTVKRSWTKGGNTRVNLPINNITGFHVPDFFSLEQVEKRQSFYFQLKDSNNHISDSYATTIFNAENLIISKNRNSVVNILEDILQIGSNSENLFYLQIYLNQSTNPWHLILNNQSAQQNSKEYRGIFAQEESNYYTLKPITKVQSKNGPKPILFGSVGFEISNPSGSIIAAVSLMDKGLVYLNTSDTMERFLMANLCTALLLQENISHD